MSELREPTGYNTNEEQIINSNNDTESFPSLSELYQIISVNENDNPDSDTTLEDEYEPASVSLDDSIAHESLSTDLNDIKEDFIQLNNEQRTLVMHIYYLYKAKNLNNSDEIIEDNPRIILQGSAGTGKSTVINFIEKLITWEENKTSNSPLTLKVLKCAFTGIAAVNIGGSTLERSFSVSFKFEDLFKQSKKDLLKDCTFFVCDEISMVGENMMSRVNTRLQQTFGNNKLYGNRFALLAGDLYQIDPVYDRRMFPSSDYWACCKFYELTKIMRQQNDAEFVTALNNFRDCQITEEDIELLSRRVIQDIAQVPDSVIHLFFLKKHVKEYNDYKIKNSSGHFETVQAVDAKNKVDLQVRVGRRYMITFNIEVGDSLANGTTGVVKHFDYGADRSVTAIWMDFYSGKIGKYTRKKYLNNENRSGFENWVPIQRSKKSRNRFPLIAAEAITVHKSQGQTCVDGVCIHLTEDPKDRLRTNRSLQYVALTRVKRLEDLYIMGTIDFSFMESKKLEDTNNELNRLRVEQKLKLAFETFDNKTGDVIVYLNTGSTFYEHYQFITADKWYGNASLLIFSETNTIASDQIVIPNFEVTFRSDASTLRSGEGIICYKKANKSMEVVDPIQVNNNGICLTLFLYKKIYIITGVKGDLSDDYFKSAIKNLFSEYEYIREERCIFFIGNFNINPNITPSLTDFLNDFNFKKKLSCDTNGESQCDVVFTRNFQPDIQPDHIGFYQYIPSSHKPIYVKLPQEPGNSQQSGDTTVPLPSSAIVVQPLFYS